MRPEPGALDPVMTRALAARVPLAVDPRRGPALKRNLHEVDVGAPAGEFAAALRQVLIEPEAAFGLVRLRRPPDRVGRDFVAGERFHGCFGLDLAAAFWGSPSWLCRLLATPAVRGLLRRIEDRWASDHAEITELASALGLQGEYRVAYRYLSGTPIAGESVYTVRPLSASSCRLEQMFSWQERSFGAIALLHGFGVRAHDDVVLGQAEAAARLLSAPILRHTFRPQRVISGSN